MLSANMSAVSPHKSSLFLIEVSALASSSICTTVVWPWTAAPIMAVMPWPFWRRLTLAPHCRSIRTTSSCSARAAAISSVLPLCSTAQGASTPPPPSSHAATTRPSPSLAARSTPTGSPSFSTAGVEALANGAIAVLAADGAALGFFLPLPFLAVDSFLAAASFSAASSDSSSIAIASAAASAAAFAAAFTSAEAAALAFSSACCRSACCLRSCAVEVWP
eukprot:scaffold52965_cov65-Phaeocystis_antarctica.AAC.2